MGLREKILKMMEFNMAVSLRKANMPHITRGKTLALFNGFKNPKQYNCTARVL